MKKTRSGFVLPPLAPRSRKRPRHYLLAIAGLMLRLWLPLSSWAAGTGIVNTFNGDSAGDNFGRSVSAAGDVNNDGYADVIVGAYLDDNNGIDSGSARVISGANGAVLYTFNGDSASDYFGWSVSDAGDVNNDGYADVIVGAYQDDNKGNNSGSARVFSGATGAVLYTFNGDSAGDNFGYSVSGAGDVNNDGYADVIVGAMYDDNSGTDSGSARVFSGVNGAVLYTFNGDSAQDYFGYSVSGAGDVNNDGYADLIVGAYGDDNGATNSGSARVISGVNGAVLYTFNGDGASDFFGYSVSAAGDVNNDDYADVIVGAHADDNNGSNSGSARVFSGTNGAILYTFNGDSADDYFGTSVSGAGDVNNDGYADVIVGAYQDSKPQSWSGSASVFSGANGAVLYAFSGDGVNDYFGKSVSGAGDTNNDGYADVIVGAYWDDNTGTDSGSARIFSGKANLTDFDGDSVTDDIDTDDDNDGVLDINDLDPLNPAKTSDTDLDGVDALVDNCPTVNNADQLNTDGDAQGNACDSDDDNDGVLDVSDSFPLDATEWEDTDTDGIGNNADSDDDNDGLSDVTESGLGTASNRVDTDYDGLSDYDEVMTYATNPLVIDSDGDLMVDGWETAHGLNPMNASDAALDTDGDGVSNVSEFIAGIDPNTVDSDSDTLADGTDNCPRVSNTDQADNDSNGIGNVCDDKAGLISAGAYHACAVTPDGAAKCWGGNSSGQLGNGSNVQRGYPTQASGLTSGIVAVAAGWQHSCALTATGAVWCWGDNYDGQLGDGSTVSRTTPVPVIGLGSGVTAIAAGASHTCAIKQDNSLLCWGRNDSGQVGNNSTGNVLSPVVVSGLASVSRVAAGEHHTCAVDAAGVKCWGNNIYGQLGDGTTTGRTAPVQVLGMVSGVLKVSVQYVHSCATLADGAVKCWGNNTYGQLGNGTTTASLIPIAVPAIAGGNRSVEVGKYHSCAVSTAGGIQCWGYNSTGQLGNGLINNSSVPVNVSGISSGAVAVSAGYSVSCAMLGNGTVQCWGDNAYGQLGNNSTAQSRVPVTIPFVLNQTITVTQHAPATAAQGSTFTVAATSNANLPVSITVTGGCTLSGNTVTVIGASGNCQVSFDQTGNDDVYAASTIIDTVSLYDTDMDDDGVLDVYDAFPNDASESIDTDNDSIGNNADMDDDGDTVADVSDNCAIIANSNQADTNNNGAGDACDRPSARLSAGYSHVCTVKNDGAVACWGYNGNWQLGDGTGIQRNTPKAVVGLGSGTAQAVAAGYNHSCALTTTGAVKCWGSNNSGQLGDGTTVSRNTPVQIMGLGNDVTAITAGSNFSCALKSNGQVMCWGAGNYGQLGQGTFASSTTPVIVPSLSGVTAIVAGGSHACAVTNAGAAKCWGLNTDGQLGVGTLNNSAAPLQVAGLASGVVSISAGSSGSCAISTDGAMQCWGDNSHYQVYQSDQDVTTPRQILGLESGTQMGDGGEYHNCAVSTSGTASCWGLNNKGQLGDNSTVDHPIPTMVSGLDTGVAAVAGGGFFNCALMNTGAVKCWGSNVYGQLGDNTATQRTVPVDVLFPQAQSITVGSPTMTTVDLGTAAPISVAASSGLPVSVTVSGTCTEFGGAVSFTAMGTCSLSFSQAGNAFYQAAPSVNLAITVSNPDMDGDGVRNDMDAFPNNSTEWLDTDADGIGNNTDTDDDGDAVTDASDNCPIAVNSDQADTNGNGIGDACEYADTSIAVGTGHGCAITAVGGVKCWGYNGAGQLGDGSNVRRLAPVPVMGLNSGVKAITAGDSHTCALTTGGAVKCWGYNGPGTLGNGTTGNNLTLPVQVVGLTSGVKAIAAGYTSTCALLETGTVQCWGSNNYGQLGDGGSPTNRATPVTVSGLSGVQAIAAGQYHVCAVLVAGGVQCWGRNNFGQLGNNSMGNSDVPVTVLGLPSVKALGVGWEHSCAITTAGALKCWGNNTSGQLGDGSTTTRQTPIEVLGMNNDVVSVSGGFSHSCARKTDGSISCWGANNYGQIGDGTTGSNRTMPVAVSGLGEGSTVQGLASGYYQNCAMLETGQIHCWGYNNYGQLGDGTTTNRLAPVIVYGTTAQTITVNAAAPAAAMPSEQFTVAATASSGLPVQVTVAGTGCSVSGNTVTMGTADCTVSYSQAGNATYLPAITQYNTVQVDNDTDSDGIGNTTDTDDDNDGVPDTLDSEPLNSAIAVMPLNGVYKGSVIRDGAGVQ